MKLESWYKSIIESSTLNPSEKVWDGIQDELDIDLVWGRLDKALSDQKRRRMMSAFAMAASLFLVIALSGILYYFISDNIVESPILVNQSSLPEEENHVFADENPIINHNSNSTLASERVKEQVPVILIDDNNISSQESISTEFDKGTDRLLRVRAVYSNAIPTDGIMIEPFAFSNTSILASAEEPTQNRFHKVYVGVTGQVANTWMLSNKTFQGMKKEEFIATNASFGTNFGLLFGIDITPQLGVKTEFYWISQNKQNYNEYLNGKYVSNSLELDYYTFTIQAKYILRQQNRLHQFMLGGYIGFMQSATQSISGRESSIYDDYKNNDYGLLLGYEFPINLGSGLTFTPGLIGKFGLANVFSGNELVPHYLNKTQNASLNLSLSLSYSLF